MKKRQQQNIVIFSTESKSPPDIAARFGECAGRKLRQEPGPPFPRQLKKSLTHFTAQLAEG